MGRTNLVQRLALLLRERRLEARISQLQLADHAGVKASVVNRAERGADARLSTWEKLFEGLGCELKLDATILTDETAEPLGEESERRHERQLEGLAAALGRRY